RSRGGTSRYLHADFRQLADKQGAVLRFPDRLEGRPEDADAVCFEDTRPVQLQATVEGGLAPKTEHDSVGSFLLDNPFNKVRIDREEVHTVCERIRGLNRSNIGVYQNGLDAFVF